MINFDEYEMRLVQSSDANQYFALIESNRDRLATFLPVTCKENESPQLTKEYLQRKQAEADARTVFTMVIVHRATNRFSGFMVIKKIDWHAGDCELGYFIDRECEGQGVMTRAVAAVITHCFEKLRLRRISIVTSAENKASVSVALKNGFTKKKTLVGGHQDLDGNKIDVDYFECVKAVAWPSLNAPKR